MDDPQPTNRSNDPCQQPCNSPCEDNKRAHQSVPVRRGEVHHVLDLLLTHVLAGGLGHPHQGRAEAALAHLPGQLGEEVGPPVAGSGSRPGSRAGSFILETSCNTAHPSNTGKTQICVLYH